MNTIFKIITLPTDENGRYILTKEAIAVLRKAEELFARYDYNDCDQTHLRAVRTIEVEDELVEVLTDMPINVAGLTEGLRFCGRLAYLQSVNGQHPLLALLREGQVLSFEPYAGAVSTEFLQNLGVKGDALYFQLEGKGKRRIRGIFDQYIGRSDQMHFLYQLKHD